MHGSAQQAQIHRVHRELQAHAKSRGGPGLGLDVLEDCAPSAALLLLVGHNFLDSEVLLATRGAHLPEAEHYMWAGGKWGCGLNG